MAQHPTKQDGQQFYFGVEVEAFLPRTPPFLYDSGARAPVVGLLQQHMQRMPAKARIVRPDGNTADADADGNPWPELSTETKYWTYKDSKGDASYNAWKVTTDASIRGEHGESVGGLEFITPKLPHSAVGLNATRHFVSGIALGGFVANDSTAVHVHVSCSHLSNRQLMRFATYAVALEEVIDRYLTPKRREDNNRYVRSNLCSLAPDSRDWREAVRRLEALDLSESIDPLVDAMNVKLAPVELSERNHKLNFTLLRGTKQGDGGRRVEFRQHQGSTDPYVVADWADFCVRFVRGAAALDESPLSAVRRFGVADAYDRVPSKLSEDFLWSLIGNDDLRHSFDFMAKQADRQPKDFPVESRELVSMREDAYEDMADITEVHQRRESVVAMPASN